MVATVADRVFDHSELCPDFPVRAFALVSVRVRVAEVAVGTIRVTAAVLAGKPICHVVRPKVQATPAHPVGGAVRQGLVVAVRAGQVGACRAHVHIDRDARVLDLLRQVTELGAVAPGRSGVTVKAGLAGGEVDVLRRLERGRVDHGDSGETGMWMSGK